MAIALLLVPFTSLVEGYLSRESLYFFTEYAEVRAVLAANAENGSYHKQREEPRP